MRVLIVGPVPSPEGGVATSISELRRAVAQTCQTAIFDPSTHGPVSQAGRWSTENAFRATRQAFRLCRAIRHERPDVVHVETGGYLGLLKSAVLVLAAKGSPSILSIHSPQVAHDAREATWLGSLLIRRGLRWTDAIRVEHSGQRAHLLELDTKLRRTRTYVIPNIVAVPDPVDERSDALPTDGDQTEDALRTDGAVRLISVGAIEQRKGSYDLIRALAE